MRDEHVPRGPVSTFGKCVDAWSQKIGEEYPVIRARYAGICRRTGQSYPVGTEIVRGEKGWELAEGWQRPPESPPPVLPPDLRFEEIGDDLGLSRRLSSDAWVRVAHLFCRRRWPGSDPSDDEDGSYMCLCDPADVHRAEDILGIPEQDRYTGTVTVIPHPEDGDLR